MLRIVALASGGGRTILNLCDRIEEGTLDAEIAVVITNRECKAVERARGRGITVEIVPWTKQTTPESYAAEVWPIIEASEPGLICLCGFLRRLPVKRGWEGRMLNIHPALLPDFGGQGMWGDHVHRAVLASGTKESGCTIHIVDDEYDRGPIVLQRRVAVYAEDTVDTLAARVFEAECEAYPEAIRLFGEGKLTIDGGRVTTS